MASSESGDKRDYNVTESADHKVVPDVCGDVSGDVKQ